MTVPAPDAPLSEKMACRRAGVPVFVGAPQDVVKVLL
jgi:hypothetical protein